MFFDNLLTESDTRSELAAATKVDPSDVLGLLGKVGCECAGAVSLWPIGVELPLVDRYRELSEQDLEKIFSDVHGERLDQVQLESRQVMSGVQHKLVVRNDRGGYELPLNGSPSTAILKRSTGRYQELAANELLCLEIVQRLDLDAPSASLIEGANGLLNVQRYDRHANADGSISRRHQEDFCQATGRVVARKYQYSGGPGLGDIAEVLRRYSVNPPEDIRRLIGIAVANVCLGNMDAHAKNFSLLYGAQGARLAPFYDIVSTEMYPGLDVNLSMKFGHTYDPRRIGRSDLVRLAKDLKVGERAVENEVERIIVLFSEILDSSTDDAVPTPVRNRIGETIRNRIAVFQAALTS